MRWLRYGLIEVGTSVVIFRLVLLVLIGRMLRWLRLRFGLVWLIATRLRCRYWCRIHTKTVGYPEYLRCFVFKYESKYSNKRFACNWHLLN